MFQAALDDGTCREIDNLYDHIAAMYAEIETVAVKREKMAEVATMQFLYPYKERVYDLNLLAAREVTYEEIVNHYGIPQNYVELYLTKTYMDGLRASHTFTVIEGRVAGAAE